MGKKGEGVRNADLRSIARKEHRGSSDPAWTPWRLLRKIFADHSRHLLLLAEPVPQHNIELSFAPHVNLILILDFPIEWMNCEERTSVVLIIG